MIERNNQYFEKICSIHHHTGKSTLLLPHIPFMLDPNLKITV